MLLNCGVGEDSWESLGLQGDPTSPSLRKSVLGVHWKDWCWSWNSNTLSTWCEELTHLKRPWCWERLRAGGEGDDRGWDGWMVSPAQWTSAWVDSGNLWWTGRPGVLQFMGLQRVRHDCATELNWTKWWHRFVITSRRPITADDQHLRRHKEVSINLRRKPRSSPPWDSSMRQASFHPYMLDSDSDSPPQICSLIPPPSLAPSSQTGLS